MRSTEKQELKKKISRLGLFLLIVFVPALTLCVILQAVAHVPQWLNILVLVLVLFVLFFFYSWLCSKLDAKKTERLNKKKDPFSD